MLCSSSKALASLTLSFSKASDGTSTGQLGKCRESSRRNMANLSFGVRGRSSMQITVEYNDRWSAHLHHIQPTLYPEIGSTTTTTIDRFHLIFSTIYTSLVYIYRFLFTCTTLRIYLCVCDRGSENSCILTTSSGRCGPQGVPGKGERKRGKHLLFICS